MKRIVNSSEMKAFDRNTIEQHGIPSLVLMERAALASYDVLTDGSFDLSNVLVVCGSGNNGGDGIAIARLLHLAGKRVSVYLAGNPDHMSEDCRKQTITARSYDLSFVNNPVYSEYTTIVDAIFGVGLSRKVEGRYQTLIEQMNHCQAKVLAVDIPSGIDADTGKVLGCAVRADATVTFAYAKVGHLLYPGKEYTGDLFIKDIGIYQSKDAIRDQNDRFFLEMEDLKKLPKRQTDGNKGTFGKVLVVAGSKGMAGAAVLCARAVMRTGAGMVKVVTHTTNRIILQQSIPEAMVGTYETKDEALKELKKGAAWADVIVCGCGLGMDGTAEAMVYVLMTEIRLPLVLDADALNLISKHESLQKKMRPSCIITPHLGEMSRLCKTTIEEIKKNLIQTAYDFSKSHSVYCVLKDAVSCVATPDGKIYLNRSGNCGMATAGSGDVLAGMIGGLLAVYSSEEYAAAFGVYLHGLAGDAAKKEYGEAYMMAEDIISGLRYVMR